MASRTHDSTPKVRLWTIYDSPLDVPGKFVVRAFTILPGQLEPVPDEKGYIVPTLEAARALLPDGLYCLGRDARDHPTVVETWI